MSKRTHRELMARRLRVENLERRELLTAGLGYGATAVVAPVGAQAGPAYVALPPGSAPVGQQIGLGDLTQQRDQDRIRDPKRDGSCQTTVTTTATLLAAPDQTQQLDKTQTRDRKKDGSCQTATATATTLSATPDQIQQQDQTRIQAPKRDGSCRT
jgi:hypothetical protein